MNIFKKVKTFRFFLAAGICLIAISLCDKYFFESTSPFSVLEGEFRLEQFSNTEAKLSSEFSHLNSRSAVLFNQMNFPINISSIYGIFSFYSENQLVFQQYHDSVSDGNNCTNFLINLYNNFTYDKIITDFLVKSEEIIVQNEIYCNEILIFDSQIYFKRLLFIRLTIFILTVLFYMSSFYPEGILSHLLIVELLITVHPFLSHSHNSILNVTNILLQKLFFATCRYSILSFLSHSVKVSLAGLCFIIDVLISSIDECKHYLSIISHPTNETNLSFGVYDIIFFILIFGELKGIFIYILHSHINYFGIEQFLNFLILSINEIISHISFKSLNTSFLYELSLITEASYSFYYFLFINKLFFKNNKSK